MRKSYLLINRKSDLKYYFPFVLLPAIYIDFYSWFGFMDNRKDILTGKICNSIVYFKKGIYTVCNCKCIKLVIEENIWVLLESEDLQSAMIGYNLLLQKNEKKIEKYFNCKINYKDIGKEV